MPKNKKSHKKSNKHKNQKNINKYILNIKKVSKLKEKTNNNMIIGIIKI